jgi:hypothetical protein
MTLPASGAISFADLNTELGRSSGTSTNLNESVLRTLAGDGANPAAIAMGDLRGKTGLPVLAAHSAEADQSVTSGTATCTLNLTNVGALSFTNSPTAVGDNGSYLSSSQWCGTTAGITAAEAANYEMQWVMVSGTTPSTTPGAQSTWLNMGTTRTWSITKTGTGVITSTFTVTIRRINGATVGPVSIDMTVQVGAP